MHSEQTVDVRPLVRVTKGNAGPEEVAALTAALLLYTRGPADAAERAPASGHRPAGWRRLERALTHRGARSWRNELRRARPLSRAGS
ncbi:acyl-CoA carboxylase epsilon subunit [Streptomyces sp. NPDC003011]